MKIKLLNFLCLFILALLIFSCSATDELNSAKVATLITLPAAQVQQTSAQSGGDVTDDGGGAITARGISWSKSQNPTIESVTKTIESGTTGSFQSILTDLTANTLYYVRAYATNEAGTAYGSQMSFTTKPNLIALPTVTTGVATSITQISAIVGGNVTNIGGAPVTERGICWSVTENPTILNSKITATGTTGSYTATLSGLSAATTYYARAYATNNGGTSYGGQISFTTQSTSTGPVGGTAVCNGTNPTAVVAITSATGKVWMDRNLGASRAATSGKDFQAYGCLYQWGRGNDGHASIIWTKAEEDALGNPAGTAVNGVTRVLSSSDTPPNALFIAKDNNRPYDWRSPKNDNLWQGAAGINNPCPSGYRIPTQAEFKAEITAYSIVGTTSAFNSIHKFPMAGNRAFDSGVIRAQGNDMFFWTSTGDFGDSYNVLIRQGEVYTNTVNARASGYSVRCIKN